MVDSMIGLGYGRTLWPGRRRPSPEHEQPPPSPVLSNIHFLSATLSFALDLAKFLGTSSIEHLLEKLQGAPNSRLWFALPPPVTSFLQKSKAGGR